VIRPAVFFPVAVTLSVVAFAVSLSTGAATIRWADVLAFPDSTSARLFLTIRLPRTVESFVCGGALGVCGAALQGVFRNPLADPALIGVSGGAALGAVVSIVWFEALLAREALTLPICAFLGAIVSVFLVHAISTQRGRVLTSTALLAGIAVNALSGAAIGWFVYGASDSQLRDFTFWSLGSLAGSGWEAVRLSAPLVGIACVGLLWGGRSLNALALGESDAWHMGAPVEWVKRIVLVSSALAVGSVTAFCGTIGFIGLVAPHLVRMAAGADHRIVLPGSFLCGGLLLCGADLVARTARSPAEIPVGIVVASVGAPVFLFLLLRGRGTEA